MADAETKAGHNGVAGDQLLSIVERIERLQEEKKEIGGQITEVLAEAKGNGFTPKYIRAVIKLRAMTPEARSEDAAMIDLYAAAIGMQTEYPLFRAIDQMGIDTAARASVIDAMSLLVPTGGTIHIDVPGGGPVKLWRGTDGEVRVEDIRDGRPL